VLHHQLERGVPDRIGLRVMPPPCDLAHLILTLIEPILTVLDKQFTPRLDIPAYSSFTTIILHRDVLCVMIGSDGTVGREDGAMVTKSIVQVWIDVLEIHEPRVRIGQTPHYSVHSQIVQWALREFGTAVIVVPHVVPDAEVFVQLAERRCVVEGEIGGRNDGFYSDQCIGRDFVGGVKTEFGVGDGELCHVELTGWLGIEFLETAVGIGETGFIIIGVARR